MNFKFTILFLLTLFQIYSSFARTNDIQRDSVIPPPINYDNIMINPHETMPYLANCSHHANKDDQKKCSDEIIISAIYNNLEYPKSALENKTEGTVIIRFTVKKDSTVSDFKIVRDIGDGCGKESLRLLQLLPKKWVPATSMGKPIEVTYHIPVKFKLKDIIHSDRFDINAPSRMSDKDTIPPVQLVKITCFPEAPTPPPPPKPLEWDESIPRIVECMPRFRGCEDLETENEKKACSKEKMNLFIKQHLKYPKIGGCIEGTVIIRFVVEVDGSLSNLEVLRDPGGGTAEEAMNVIRQMPKWIPGKEDGKVTRCYFVLPVKFQS